MGEQKMSYRPYFNEYLSWCAENNIKPIIKQGPDSYTNWLKRNNLTFEVEKYLRSIINQETAIKREDERRQNNVLVFQ